jgi:hypothetical protein
LIAGRSSSMMKEGVPMKAGVMAGLCLLLVGSDSLATTTVNCSRLQETFISSNTANTNASGSCGYVLIATGTSTVSHVLAQFAVPNLGGRESVDSVTIGMGTLQALFGTNPSSTCSGAPNNVPNGFPAFYSTYPITEFWNQGGGCGAAASPNWHAGSACLGGANWNLRDCTNGWLGGPGGSVGGAVGPSLSTFSQGPGAFISATQSCSGLLNTWCSVVQSWADVGSGPGWRISSNGTHQQCGIQFFSKNASMSFNYTCKAGFQETGSGCTSCTTTNNNNCVTGATGNVCNDTGGNVLPAYSCTCGNAAYTTGIVSGKPGCVNLDECLGNPCDNNGDTTATCADIAAPGTGHNCTCTAGFKLNGPNGTSTVSCVSDCTTGAGGSQKTASDPCVGTPINVVNNFCTPTATPGQWTCTCASGWSSSGGVMPSCQDTNECTAGSGNTSCQTAVAGGGNSCTDATAPSVSWTCTCGSAYTGTGTTSCVDRNDCAGSPNPCAANGDTAATCTDVAAPARGRTCGCTAGFILSGTNGTPTATCVSGCTTGAGGTQKTAQDPCAGTPANVGNNFCTPGTAGQWICTCASGWTSTGGTNPTCHDTDECTAGSGDTSCKTSVVGSGNTCSDATAPSLSWSCNCGPAYDGDGTTTCTDHNACLPTDHCRDGGDTGASEKCIDAIAPAIGYSCTCDTGFTFDGTTCTSTCHPGNNPCAANGDTTSTCSVLGTGGWSCACTAGYAASAGIVPTCNNINACTAAANTACVTTRGNTCVDEAPPSLTYHCTCPNAAYVLSANTRACNDKNECVPNNCITNGDTGALCVDHVAPATGYSCTCSSRTAWTLTTVAGKLTCVDTDECAVVAPSPNPCGNGTCTNIPLGGGYSCMCDPGYNELNGTTPSPSCFHPDSCGASTDTACVTDQTGNRCVDNPPPRIGYTCDCENPAYTLSEDGQTCIDKNACAINHCIDGGDRGGNCVDKRAPKAGYSCVCDPGFVFDGTTCADVDECRAGGNPCGPHGTCGNTVGGYQCDCGSGFVLVAGPTCKPGNVATRVVVTVIPGSCSLGGRARPPSPLWLLLLVLAVRRFRRV